MSEKVCCLLCDSCVDFDCYAIVVVLEDVRGEVGSASTAEFDVRCM